MKIRETKHAEKDGDKSDPLQPGHQLWANVDNRVQVRTWPHPEDPDTRLVCVRHLHHHVNERKGRRRSWHEKATGEWAMLRPVFRVERKRAILVALDLVGHLIRMKKENPSLIALSGVLGHVARLYGWDGTARELPVDKERLEARRAASKDEE